MCENKWGHYTGPKKYVKQKGKACLRVCVCTFQYKITHITSPFWFVLLLCQINLSYIASNGLHFARKILYLGKLG